tara:strand:+ start:105 stop:746 length:642 start_codon:yes stop_codon:yes gene_type:complete
MKKLLLLLIIPFLSISQPSFNVTDANGNLWDSESLLATGKTIIVTFFSPSETCWPSANQITKLSEAYNAYQSCNDLFFIQVAQWGSEYTTTNYVEQFGNPNIPAIVGYYQGQELTMSWVDWGLQWAYETWLLRPDGSYEFDIPYAWDLDQQVLIDALEAEGFIECEHSMSIQSLYNNKQIIQTIDILGRETTNKGFQLEIYDDGTVEKKYVIK